MGVDQDAPPSQESVPLVDNTSYTPDGGHDPQQPGGATTPTSYQPAPGGHSPYPPQHGSGAYPPQYPPQGAYPPQHGGHSPQPPRAQGGYPPQQGGHSPQPPQGGYPPQYPPQGAYPPQHPPQGAYPPQQGRYSPQPPHAQGGYPAQATPGAYPTQAYGGQQYLGASYTPNPPPPQGGGYKGIQAAQPPGVLIGGGQVINRDIYDQSYKNIGILSVVSCLCFCCPLGCAALYCVYQSNQEAKSGNIDSAWSNLNQAKKVALAAIVFGIIGWIIFVLRKTLHIYSGPLTG